MDTDVDLMAETIYQKMSRVAEMQKQKIFASVASPAKFKVFYHALPKENDEDDADEIPYRSI